MGSKSIKKPIVTRKLIALIKKNGFYNAKGTKHGKYQRDGDDHKFMVPRHKTISPGLSQQMCKELIDIHGIDEHKVMKLF